MAHTNSTENYGLPQWIGTDKPTFLGDFNSAFATIDTGMKASADVATAAAATANSAEAVASSAATNATNAISIANNAASEASSASSAASSATATANTAKSTAESAMRASASNSIENLAPAYDPTLTYNVGDLVTYIDAQNSGKLYKCIVAVNTPMDFNINYWDDVTTSEVYAQPRKKITLSVAANTTNKDFLNELYTRIGGIDFTNGVLILSRLTTGDSYEYRICSKTANSIAFINESFVNTSNITLLSLIASTNSHSYRYDFNTSAYRDTTDDAVVSENATAEFIYE